jgi:hypothetical protein
MRFPSLLSGLFVLLALRLAARLRSSRPAWLGSACPAADRAHRVSEPSPQNKSMEIRSAIYFRVSFLQFYKT